MTELLAQTLAGIVMVPLLNLLKRLFKVEGTPMAWLAFLASFPVGVVALTATGGLKLGQITPEAFFQAGAAVFAVSQVVYRTLKERLK